MQVLEGGTKTKRVLLVDDHAVLRGAVRDLIAISDDFVVVDEVANGDDAILVLDGTPVDIVLMDVNMPGIGGIEATHRIKRWHPEVEVVALSATGDLAMVQGMIDAGASGYVMKGGSPEELLRSLRSVAQGKGVLDDTVTRGVFEEMSRLYREEQERVEELAQLNRMKTEFLSVISHELQTPLAIIKAGIHLLHNHPHSVDDETRNLFFTSIAQETDELSSIVDKMLTVAAIQQGDVTDSAEPAALGVIAWSAVNSFKGGPDFHRIRLDVKDDGIVVTGDRARLVKVVRALIDNALSFSDGDVTVIVEDRDGMGSVSVSDEGPGLDPELRERVLVEPFVQGDSSNTREHGGLGLSLYIANGVVNACDGRFVIEDDGTGATFRMMLPMVVPSTVRQVRFG